MSQKIAVAIIHGAGSQGPEFAAEMIDLLTVRLRSYWPDPDASIGDKIVIKPVYWADVLAERQRRLWETLDADAELSFEDIRRFLVNFASDAVAYQPSLTRRETYNRIHQRLADVLADLAQEAGPIAPLCIIAHSIGSIIAHNYFFDLTQPGATNTEIVYGPTPLENGQTLALLYMMGSPLAFWSIRYDEYQAITFPGSALAETYPQITPRWINYYDQEDILAYPIRSLSPTHYLLAETGLLYDVPVNVGNILTSWNPASHFGYWTDVDIIQPIADALAEAWQAINIPAV